LVIIIPDGFAKPVGNILNQSR